MDNISDNQALNDSDRLAALDATGLLDADPQAHFDRITELVAELLQCKVAVISLVDTDRQFFLSHCGLDGTVAAERGTPLSHSFCQHVVTSQAPLIIDDARTHPLVNQNPAIVDLGVVAYLGIPIATRERHVLGSLCAIETLPRHWTPDNIRLLSKFARIVEDEIALGDRATDAHIRAGESETLAREYHHRVKNALAVSAALVRLSAKGASTVAEVVDLASGRLISLASAHDALMSTSDAVDLEDLLKRLLRPYWPPNSVADVGGPPVRLRNHQITPFCLFLHELATNSAKYGAFRDELAVTVRWTEDMDQNVVLRWNENLNGGTDARPKAGFGGKLFTIAAGQLGGSFTTKWAPGQLVVELAFPANVELSSSGA